MEMKVSGSTENLPCEKVNVKVGIYFSYLPGIPPVTYELFHQELRSIFTLIYLRLLRAKLFGKKKNMKLMPSEGLYHVAIP